MAAEPAASVTTSPSGAQPLELDLEAARRLHLAAQGLSIPPMRAATKSDVLNCIRRMGALQIDTISVVARSPYFVLWSRLGDYDPAWLNQLLAQGRLFEYWAHAACFLPIEDYPLYRPFMRLDSEIADIAAWKRWRDWSENNQEVIDRVLAAINARGEAKSSDFERTDEKAGRFWAWKKEKLALECLFRMGEVMTLRRDAGFQRIYGLPERHLRGRAFPSTSRADAVREFALKAVKCLGIAKPSWVPDYFRLKTAGMSKLLEEQAETGALVRATVNDWKEPMYVHADNMRLARRAASGKLAASVTTFLTPFDPVVWHRKRLKELFDFTYQIEVYTPIEKRRYGYFTMPILHNAMLVGRVDAKAHRSVGEFEVRALHLEEGADITEELLSDVSDALVRCAEWHQTPRLRISAKGPFASALAGRTPE